jgi:hypothetical protein
MLVRFSDPDEFVAELARDPHAVARKLVRVTSSRYPVMNAAVTRLTVVAGAKVLSQTVGADGEGHDLVELTAFVGDLWGQEANDNPVLEKAQALMEDLEAKLTVHGFTTAAGRYEIPAVRP